ncbi:hypothetical protein HII31_02839 [Pseudocercospora fuligena]|uniref:Uncharacterized protein n=1 Tax=Pseudocercospora fuligena TaxID=685502 RepID=A0A8H6VMK2_9PEZI|nr:hypothetical protein HII31_02839 [Pseudocercospora fuligena]
MSSSRNRSQKTKATTNKSAQAAVEKDARHHPNRTTTSGPNQEHGNRLDNVKMVENGEQQRNEDSAHPAEAVPQKVSDENPVDDLATLHPAPRFYGPLATSNTRMSGLEWIRTTYPDSVEDYTAYDRPVPSASNRDTDLMSEISMITNRSAQSTRYNTKSQRKRISTLRRYQISRWLQGRELFTTRKITLIEILDFVLERYEDNIAGFIRRHPVLVVNIMRTILVAGYGTLFGIQIAHIMASILGRVYQFLQGGAISRVVGYVLGRLLRAVRVGLPEARLAQAVIQEEVQPDHDEPEMPAVPPMPSMPPILHLGGIHRTPEASDQDNEETVEAPDHPRFDFEPTNYTKHPHSRFIELFRPVDIGDREAFGLFRNVRHSLEQLGTVRQVPAAVGAKFEIIPLLVQQKFAEPFANIDGNIMLTRDAWDVPIRGVELLSLSIYEAQTQDLPQVDRYRPVNLPYLGSGESISAFECEMEGVEYHGAPPAQHTNNAAGPSALNFAQNGHAHVGSNAQTHRIMPTGSKVLKRKHE